MNIVYAPRALSDLEIIAAYLNDRNPSGARRVLASIKSSIDTLEFFPQIGALADEAGHRRLPILQYPYMVFYRVAEEELFILHIRHTARTAITPEKDL